MIGYLARRLSDLPDGDDWLTAAEREWFSDRRSAKRVADWRLGRWTAKAAVASYIGLQGHPPTGAVEVLAASDGAPEAFVNGEALPVAVSLSHSHGRAVSAVAAAGSALGCDLERIEPRSPAFIESYLTVGERVSLAAADEATRQLLANLFWSAKESALKALRRGLRADPRSLEVTLKPPSGRAWQNLRVVGAAAGVELEGRWARLDRFVVTIVARPAPEEIVDLG